MVNSFLESLEKLWDEWNIRAGIIFSLLLQIFLILFAPFRKRSSSKLVIMLIWSAYLLADATANLTIALISHRQINSQESDLVAFWGPFLLLHLGGPDTITAFSLEDNEFWLRHLIHFIVQALATGYVFLQTFPENKVMIPTLLLFVAGSIKYLERTRSLYLSSMNTWRSSVWISSFHWPFYKYTIRKNKLNEVQMAYRLFLDLKPTIVDFPLCHNLQQVIPEYFNRLFKGEALRVMEIELNFFYEALFTKAVVIHSKWGGFFRFISFASVVSALAIFHFSVNKNDFNSTLDVDLTYLLLFGAIGLDLIAVFMAIFSDWTAAYLKRSDNSEFDLNSLTDFFNALTVKIFFKYLTIKRVFSRRWSNWISGNNLIRYCLKGSPTRIHVSNKRRPCGDLMQINTIFQFSFIDKVIYFTGLKDLVDEMIYVSSEPFTEELWEFIYDEVKRKFVSSYDPETAKEICSSRGEWILRHQESIDVHGLMPYVKDVSFDQSILLWHIATEILYNTDDEKNSNPRSYGNREFSKILSDYLFYLLTIQPNLIAVAAGGNKIRIKKVYVEVERLFKARKLRWNELKKACQSILDMEDDRIMDLASIASTEWAEGQSYRYLLTYASFLAKELKQLEEQQQDKWEMMGKVWMEMLCYGVCRFRPYNLVQQLPKGGALFTFVWLLLAHFGILGK